MCTLGWRASFRQSYPQSVSEKLDIPALFLIAYEDPENVLEFSASFYCELDKDTISLLLNNPRIYEIFYCVGDPPVGQDF